MRHSIQIQTAYLVLLAGIVISLVSIILSIAFRTSDLFMRFAVTEIYYITVYYITFTSASNMTV